VVLGQIERRKGSCAQAKPHWDAAVKVLVAIRKADPDDRPSFLWLGRVHFGRALCRVEAGDLKGAEAHLKDAVMIGWGGGGKVQIAEVRLVDALILYETGDVDHALRLFPHIAFDGDERVRTALEGWMKATGATLR
jgi:hypothetical protein